MRRAWLLALALVGCGSGSELPAPPDTNQIERLSTPAKADPAPDPARLVPLTAADMASNPSVCRFSVGQVMMVAADADGATVRTPQGLRHLVASSPVAATGGFFEDRQLSLSIGREDGAATAGVAARPASARMTVTNRRSATENHVRGLWGCDN